MKKGNGTIKVNNEEMGIQEYLKAAELASELGDAVDRYHTKDLYERTKTAILPDMFENEEDYNYFMNQIKDFFNAYEGMLQETRMNLSSGKQQGKTMQVIKDLRTKFPKQFDAFVLLHVFIEKDTPYVTNACLSFLGGKSVYFEKFMQDSNGYKYIELISTDEMDINFLRKEPQKREGLNLFLRKLSREENEVFSQIEIVSGLEYLSPQDVVLCAKSSKYAGALFYNLASYIDIVRESDKGQTEQSLITLTKAILPYVNINKLRMVIICKALLYAKQLDGDDQANLEDVENTIKVLTRDLKASKNTRITANGINVDFYDWKAIDFEEREERNLSARGNPPILVFSSESQMIKMSSEIDLTLDISSKEVIAAGEEFLDQLAIKRFLISYDEGNIESFDFDLRKTDTVNEFRKQIYFKIKKENPGASIDEIENICFEYLKGIIKQLHSKKLLKVSDLRKLDESALCELIAEGNVEISNNELSKYLFSKQAIVFLCCVQPERLMDCLNKKYITKEDLLSVKHIPASLVKTLFENDLLTLNEIFDLAKNKRIDLSLIKNVQFDKNKLSVFLNPEQLAELYVQIIRKKTEYENESRSNIEASDDAEEIEPTEKELQLQSELQVLINQKNILVYLIKYLDLKGKDNIDFSENAYLSALDLTDDMEGEFLAVTEEMYADGIISMAQINDFDAQLLFALIKRGVIRLEDIDDFKKHLVSEQELEEIEEFRDILDVDEYLNEVEKVRYAKIKKLLDEIIKDKSISYEEKLGIIYNILTLETPIEKMLRKKYESVVLSGEIDSTFDYAVEVERLHQTDKKKKTRRKDENAEGTLPPKEVNGFVYSPYVIWQFMRLIDPNVQIKGYKDGNVVFCSKKINKAIIESVWKGNGETVQRSYGVATISMSLDTFEENFSSIVVYGRKGYKINTYNAKSVLPTIPTPKGTRLLGVIRHNKDLKSTGRKDWFDLLLDDFGISLTDIKDGKDSRYTKEDAEEIETFLKAVRENKTYERI